MRLNFLSELSPQQVISEKATPGQQELFGFLYMMAAGQGQNADSFVKEVRTLIDPEFLKKRQAKARGTQWLQMAGPGDETNAVIYGRKVRLRVLEGVIKEADVSDVLTTLGLDDADIMRLMDQFDIADKDYNLSALRQALRRAGGNAKDAVKFTKEAETGKPATPVQAHVPPGEEELRSIERHGAPVQPEAPAAPRSRELSPIEKMSKMRQAERSRKRFARRLSRPRFTTPTPAAAGPGPSSEFYSTPQV